jgi:hypothetical protein
MADTKSQEVHIHAQNEICRMDAVTLAGNIRAKRLSPCRSRSPST